MYGKEALKGALPRIFGVRNVVHPIPYQVSQIAERFGQGFPATGEVPTAPLAHPHAQWGILHRDLLWSIVWGMRVFGGLFITNYKRQGSN